MNCKKMMAGFATLAVAASLPAAVLAGGSNTGPYVGGGAGYNEVGDQTFDFRGTRTNPTQPTAPAELTPIPNDGIAAENSYKGNYFFQAVGGYRFENGLRPEFEMSYRQNDVDESFFDPALDSNAEAGARARAAGNTKLTQTSGMFNLWYDLFPSSKWHPYVGGGFGFTRLKLNKQQTNRLSAGDTVNSSPDPGDILPGPPVCLVENCSGPRKSDDAALAYQLGAGVRWDMMDHITVGLDYRYVKAGEMEFYAYKDQQETHLDSDYDAQSVMLSVNYFFDKPAPPVDPTPPPAVEAVAPVSICSDGQDNDGDGLVDFPNDPGCAAADDGDETDPPQCSDGKDNDGDGLADHPNDPGCTGADDNDEVDPCKTPAPGERISLKGCGLGDVIVLRGVNFEFDKSRLTANAKTILDNVGEELTAYPEITVELSGHTDAKGSDSYNQSLSERRVNSVKQYLVGKGIDGDRMTTVGEGEAKPVADNETDEGRELNRRVELKVTSGVAPGGPAVTAEAADPTAAVEAADEVPAADAVDAPVAE